MFQGTAWNAYFGTFPVGQPSKTLPDTPTLEHFLSIKYKYKKDLHISYFTPPPPSNAPL